MVVFPLGKFYESKRRKATGLKQLISHGSRVAQIYYLYITFLVCLYFSQEGLEVMIFPTVYCKETGVRHIVKDRNTCVCGFKYHVFSTFTKSDFKRIQFKKVYNITCPKCKVIASAHHSKTPAHRFY